MFPWAKPGSTGGSVTDNAVSSAGVLDAQTTTAPRAMPRETPLTMPRRRLHEQRHPMHASPRPWAVLRTAIARLCVTAITALLASYGILEMYGVLSTATITALQWGFLLLFAVNFTWVAFAFAQALVGFLASLIPRLFPPAEFEGELPFRSAVLLPVYNEDPVPVAAAIRTMRQGLAAREPGKYAFFILSDTNQPGAWLREEAVFRQLVDGEKTACPVYYRHRATNTERKAGNIAEWVRHWGGGFEAMIILDADSLVSPESLISLTRRLAAEPGLGLIQTLPKIVRARSLYGRLQQFANQCYGPIYGRGLAAWYGWCSNYWGHNAIIRTRAFADSCSLPILNGEPPIGGPVLSHDFIEAAMLRRAGWGVRFDCDIGQSFEEAPPSLDDVIIRDRRWCQGNLQHSRFLLAHGLPLSNRVHLLSGIMSYLSAAFWLALVLVGLAIAVQAALTSPAYFSQPSLFPTWPVFDAERAGWLFGISMAVILAPKWFGGVLVMLNLRRLREFGGPLSLPLSLAFEILLSALYAPILMVAQTRAIWQVLKGSDGGWQPQSRDDGSIDLSTALRAHWPHTLLGGVLAAIAWLLSTHLFFWLLPITAGLLLSVPLSWLSGGEGRGRLFDRIGLLRAPEERRPCQILSRLKEELQHGSMPPSCIHGLRQLQSDSGLRQWHLAQLPPAIRDVDRAVFDAPAVTAEWKARHASTLEELETWLTAEEFMALLNNRTFLCDVLYADISTSGEPEQSRVVSADAPAAATHWTPSAQRDY